MEKVMESHGILKAQKSMSPEERIEMLITLEHILKLIAYIRVHLIDPIREEIHTTMTRNPS